MENRNPDGFYYSERRTVDSKRNVIANAHEEAVNVNDISPPRNREKAEGRLGKKPVYMGLDAGYPCAWGTHFLAMKNLPGGIGYGRHTHNALTYGPYRFKCGVFRHTKAPPQWDGGASAAGVGVEKAPRREPGRGGGLFFLLEDGLDFGGEGVGVEVFGGGVDGDGEGEFLAVGFDN